MPKSHRAKPLYQRGEYRLDRWPDRKNLVITRYDPERKRERVTSAGTSDLDAAKKALDALYLAEAVGESTCPTCGQPVNNATRPLVTSVISDYLVAHAENLPSASALRHRLAHVVDYAGTLERIPRIDQIDEAWVARFRAWFRAKPIVSPKKHERQRSESTVENSVLQLAAAINWQNRRDHVLERARFRTTPVNTLNRPPKLRADVDMLIRMFRYATEPNQTGERIGQPNERRHNLLRFLRISVATMARPDAAHDVSVDPARDQWHSEQRVLALNPKGRRQTAKRRAMVPIAPQVALELDALAADFDQERVQSAFYIPVNSVKGAFDSMTEELKLPGGGEAGMKLIRRSLADIVRDRLGEDMDGVAQLEVWLGHRIIKSTTELYAPFRPNYLKRVRAIIEQVITEIEKAVPGAFYHSVTTPALRVVGGAA